MADPPAPIASLRLAVSGLEVVLGPGEHTVGRAADCAVVVDDPLASRHHAAITVGAEGVIVRDLGSRNGVLVNGEEIGRRHALCAGDLVTIGSQALFVRSILRAGEVERPSSAPPAADSPAAEPPAADPPVADPPARRPAPLGRIAVQKRAVREPSSEGGTEAAALATLNLSAPVVRPAAAFRLIVEAGKCALATTGAEKAERILMEPLGEVVATLRGGHEVECEIFDLAVEQAICLCEATGRPTWADYVRELYDQMRIPVPPPVADRLALAMQRPR
jgi:pSer/pThr/pTyr-binding forkhead associated (FHA) protein